MSYGLPWQGSKNAIADWIIEQLPPSRVFVDLFAGGCAVTHAALLSSKWDRVVANDITDGPEIFANAIAGKYHDYWPVLTRDEFASSNDTLELCVYSFKNDLRTYLYGAGVEAIKTQAARMLTAPTVPERRREYRRFVKELGRFLRQGGSLSPNAEALERLERVQALERLERVKSDYQSIDIPEGATVYADPPYLNTRGYGVDFDYERFWMWLSTVPYPVFVSEYTPPPGCVEISNKERIAHTASTGCQKVVERLFVQERYA